ncbi:SET domain-containing protein, partial [Saccharata proteae CBS 121410]
CDAQCYNRCTNTECNSKNCIIGPDCGNRAFADLAMRAKSAARTDMGRLYDLGVEVMETKDRGRGVRAMRAFEKDQVIMEYIGEIITQTESDRRVKNDYKDHRCFYLMTFHQKLIIDGYRGNVARFVNHSCEPNCRMEKWMVNGDLRMALFANRLIMTGEELTWNYSFESYGKEQECLCGARTCRGAIGK